MRALVVIALAVVQSSAGCSEEVPSMPDAPWCTWGPPGDPCTYIGEGGVFSGTFDPEFAVNHLVATCTSSSGAERVYVVQVVDDGRGLWATTDYSTTTVDTVLYVRKSCSLASTEIACDDDNPESINTSASTVVVDAIPPGDWYVILDTLSIDMLGAFTISVSLHGSPGTACEPASESACLPGYACTGDPPTCEAL